MVPAAPLCSARYNSNNNTDTGWTSGDIHKPDHVEKGREGWKWGDGLAIKRGDSPSLSQSHQVVYAEAAVAAAVTATLSDPILLARELYIRV